MFNEFQKNAFTSVLRTVEEMLHDVRLKLLHPERQGILFEDFKDDIVIKNKDEVLQRIAFVEDIIKQLQQQFDLKPRTIEVKRSIRGTLYYCLQTVEDARAKRMKGYGSVSPGLDLLIDPPINQIKHFIQEILQLIGP